MNILLDSLNFNIHNVFFLEKKKNTVIDGSFTKLVYSTNYFTMNGLYFTLPFLCKPKKQSCKQIKYGWNAKITGREAIGGRENSGERNSKEFEANSGEKSSTELTNVNQGLKNLDSSHSAKISGREAVGYRENSGERSSKEFLRSFTEENVIPYKSTIHFYPHDVINLQYIISLSEIESAILTLYKSMNDINKKSKVILTSQLYSGCFKIYKEHSIHYGTNPYFLKISGIWETPDEIGITYKIIETVKISRSESFGEIKS
jgi:hypothetical protein